MGHFTEFLHSTGSQTLILPDDIPVYGDASFRGKCPPEHIEQASFFSRLRREYPGTLGLIAIHPRNEGLKEKGQFSAVLQHKAEGMVKGASDIVIPARIPLVVELKRQDHTQSNWQSGQKEYLRAAAAAGAFVGIGLGARGAWAALQEWMTAHAPLA